MIARIVERGWPTLLVLAACIGIALANAVRAPTIVVAFVVVVTGVAAMAPEIRLPACALALVLVGWWWGSVRLDALDRSVLA